MDRNEIRTDNDGSARVPHAHMQSGTVCDDAIAALTDDVLRERSHLLEPLLERYMMWIWKTGREPLRSSHAYTHEILTFGVLWRCYGRRAVALPPPFAWLMSGLTLFGERFPRMQPMTDRMRRCFAYPLLGPRFGDEDATGIPSRCETRALLGWMHATGEFEQELPRLCQFRAFLDGCDRYEREWYLAQLSAFTARFGMLAAHRASALHPDTAGNRTASDTDGTDASSAARERPGPVVHTRIEHALTVIGGELRRRAAAPAPVHS